MGLMQKLFGTHSEHELKRIYPIVDKVESYRDAMGALSDEQLKGKTKEFKERLAKGETLDDILPEALCCCQRGWQESAWNGALPESRLSVVLFFIRDVSQRCVQVKVKRLYLHCPAYLNALDRRRRT